MRKAKSKMRKLFETLKIISYFLRKTKEFFSSFRNIQPGCFVFCFVDRISNQRKVIFCFNSFIATSTESEYTLLRSNLFPPVRVVDRS